jgi:hypothetical protein
VVPYISKDLYLSKEMDWGYTMVGETFEYCMLKYLMCSF